MPPKVNLSPEEQAAKAKVKEYNRAYYLAHKSERTTEQAAVKNAYLHAYYLANKTKLAADARTYRLTHKEECSARSKAYHIEHMGQARANSRAWKKANPEKVAADGRRGNLRRTYGITIDDYARMYGEQSGKCAICTIHYDALEVDHNHKTGVVRGLLCNECNSGMGLLSDAAHLLDAAANYLDAHTTVMVRLSPEALKSSKPAWGTAHLSPDYERNRKLRSNYGITPDMYSAAYQAQDGRCAVCNTYKDCLNVDHDHVSKRVRGLLCLKCNHALGKFKDDTARICAARRYLEVTGG